MRVADERTLAPMTLAVKLTAADIVRELGIRWRLRAPPLDFWSDAPHNCGGTPCAVGYSQLGSQLQISLAGTFLV
jgi:hypothetical protein